MRSGKTTAGALAVLGMIACGGNVRYEGGNAGGAAGGLNGATVVGVGGASGISSSSSGPSDGPTTITGVGAGGSDPGCNPETIGATVPLWLDNRAYDNTVRDLLGDASAPSIATGFPDDDRFDGFRRDIDEGSSPSQIRYAHFMRAKDYLLGRTKIDRSSLAGCGPALGDEACASAFIGDFGKRAYRRPLAPDETLELFAAFKEGASAGGFAEGIKSVMGAALVSRHFLQIEEQPSSTIPTALGPYAIASRLSYFIYRSMPDAELFASAASGKLSEPDEIGRQATRMLADQKAHQAAIDFVAEWLNLDRLTGSPWDPSRGSIVKDPAVAPNFAAINGYMRTETEKFAESILFGDQPFATLLSSTQTWLNEPLAALYGVSGFSGTEFRSGNVDPGHRAGILTQASILSIYANAYESSPTRRGQFVSETLSCFALPPPPPEVPAPPPPPPGTYRERYEANLNGAACRPCHVYLEGIGFAFDEFDLMGRYRTTIDGKSIDTAGSLPDNFGLATGPFKGPVELSKRLNASDEVRQCMMKQVFRFALSRSEAEEESCWFTTMLPARVGPAPTFKQLVTAIATSPAFLHARR